MKRTWCVLTALLAVAASLIPDATLLAQTGTIRGTVTDSATAFPLEGALVTVVGTALQAQTNPSGQYRISRRVVRRRSGPGAAHRLRPGRAAGDGARRRGDDGGLHPGGRSRPARGDRLGRLRQQCPGRAQYRRLLGRLGPDRQSADREHRRRPPGEGPRRGGDPERGQSGQRHERPGPRHGLDLGQQRPALRRGRGPDRGRRHFPARPGRPDPGGRQRAQPR